jgi:DNA-binding protein HU-beta
MNKMEFAAFIAGKNGVETKDAALAVGIVFDALQKALLAGERVVIAGVGTLSIIDSAARKGRNPRTGAEINIPARKRLKIVESIGLKRKMGKA